MKLEQLSEGYQWILNNNNIKQIKIYYIRELKISVCLLITKSNIIVARGIAFCSKKDQFSKKKGRAIAIDRAVKAIRCDCDLDEFPFVGKKVNRNTIASFIARGHFGTIFMANHYPHITPYERKVLRNIKDHS